ncbi:hypothetical protein SAMN04489806_1626 [Paramicrobacterium humi]|uniref:DinB superfamily protein n=1 Tax=Paramicrobacterium humi TaxID=640635 RepID=A0A1H4LQK3_9MICO|nr:DinB family protein [Microbacterium humi]SEB72917.1 hypothetical protein SAMN04489806_1626 [Microbacterium humi]
MAITPDTKDWTWVIERRCPECGFDASTLELDEVGDMARTNAGIWAEVLERPDVAVRPDAATWSPLEYACHVRDVHNVFAERLVLMMTHDDPEFADWDQDAAAEAGAYAEQDPRDVSTQLMEAAFGTAEAFDAVPAEYAARTGLRSNGSRFTIETLGRYYAHDLVHHAWDVTRDRG